MNNLIVSFTSSNPLLYLSHEFLVLLLKILNLLFDAIHVQILRFLLVLGPLVLPFGLGYRVVGRRDVPCHVDAVRLKQDLAVQ